MRLSNLARAAAAAAILFSHPVAAMQKPADKCPVIEASIEAFVNAMPGTEQPKLIVSGTVTLPSAGWNVRLSPSRTDKSGTAYFTLHLRRPQMGAQVITTYDVRAERKATQDVQTVVVLCGGREIARDTVEKVY
jgi:hypothetical protein